MDPPDSTDLDYQILCLFDKMWNYPGKEVIIVYQNIPGLAEHIGILSLRKLLNIEEHTGGTEGTRGTEGIGGAYYHPALVFICLGIQTGFISGSFGVGEVNGNSVFKSKKINLNRYQECDIQKGELVIKLKVPDLTSPLNFDRVIFKDPKVERHPQLRRIIKKFVSQRGGTFDEKILLENLSKLGSDNPNYLYEDADELILRNYELCCGTYLEWLPLEIKEIIIKNIDNSVKVSSVITSNKSIETLFKAAESVVENVLEERNVSIMDIFDKMRNNGSLDPLVEMARNDSNGNIYKYMTSQIGLHNIVNVIKKKLD